MADLRISVVIPVKNGEATIAAALDSVLIQTYIPAEVIVVDDGSTDSTPQILEAYSAKYPQVRRVVAAGSGISDALNQGIAEASGNLIARIDGDDLCFPEYLLRYCAHAGQVSRVNKAKGLCASVGATYSAMRVERGLTDPAVKATSTQELVTGFLNEIANGEIPFNKQLLKVVTRAFAGLRETSEGQQVVQQLSRQIAGSLLKSGHPLQAFKIYRHGRK